MCVRVRSCFCICRRVCVCAYLSVYVWLAVQEQSDVFIGAPTFAILSSPSDELQLSPRRSFPCARCQKMRKKSPYPFFLVNFAVEMDIYSSRVPLSSERARAGRRAFDQVHGATGSLPASSPPQRTRLKNIFFRAESCPTIKVLRWLRVRREVLWSCIESKFPLLWISLT